MTQERSKSAGDERSWNDPNGLGWQLWRRAHTTGLLTTRLQPNAGHVYQPILRNPVPLASDIWRRWGRGSTSAGHRFYSDLPLFLARFPLWYARTPPETSASTPSQLLPPGPEAGASFSSPLEPAQTRRAIQRPVSTPFPLPPSGHVGETGQPADALQDRESSTLGTAPEHHLGIATGPSLPPGQSNVSASASGRVMRVPRPLASTIAFITRQQRTQPTPLMRHRDIPALRTPMVLRPATPDRLAPVQRQSTRAFPMNFTGGQSLSYPRDQSLPLSSAAVVVRRHGAPGQRDDLHAAASLPAAPQPREHATEDVIRSRPELTLPTATRVVLSPVVRYTATHAVPGTRPLQSYPEPSVRSTLLRYTPNAFPLPLSHSVALRVGVGPLLQQQPYVLPGPEPLAISHAGETPSPAAASSEHPAGIAQPPPLPQALPITRELSQPFSPSHSIGSALSLGLPRQPIGSHPLARAHPTTEMVGPWPPPQSGSRVLAPFAPIVRAPVTTVVGVNSAWIHPRFDAVSRLWVQPRGLQPRTQAPTDALPYPDVALGHQAAVDSSDPDSANVMPLDRGTLPAPMPLMRSAIPLGVSPQPYRIARITTTTPVGAQPTPPPLPLPPSGTPLVVAPMSQLLARSPETTSPHMPASVTSILRNERSEGTTVTRARLTHSLHAAGQTARALRPDGRDLHTNLMSPASMPLTQPGLLLAAGGWPQRMAGMARSLEPIADGELHTGQSPRQETPDSALRRPDSTARSPVVSSALAPTSRIIAQPPLPLYLRSVAQIQRNPDLLPMRSWPAFGPGASTHEGMMILSHAALTAKSVQPFTSPLRLRQPLTSAHSPLDPVSAGRRDGPSEDLPLVALTAPEGQGGSPPAHGGNGTIVQASPLMPAATMAAEALPVGAGEEAAPVEAEVEAAQAPIDVDELVEKAWQKFMHKLTIEQERRGVSRWL